MAPIESRLICGECHAPMRVKMFKLANGREVPSEGWTMVGYQTAPAGHSHDDNCWTRMYVCPAGHLRKVARRRRCNDNANRPAACDWVGKLECFCHEGEKVDAWPSDESPSTAPSP